MIYSKDIKFAAPAGVATCVPLPCHMRAELSHLTVAQIGGTDGFVFTVYDRRGACVNAIDWYCLGGKIKAITDNGNGKCRLTVTAADMIGLGFATVVADADGITHPQSTIPQLLEVKGNTVAGYNVLVHQVMAIGPTPADLSGDQWIDTDQAYSDDGADGMWQTAPLVFPTIDPVVHKVVDTTTVAAGTAVSSTDLVKNYQNRDNQQPYARRMQSTLYLEITPAGSGSKTFVVSYSADARNITA